MDKNEFKKFFLELLDDEEFKIKLKNFILDAINEKISTSAENAANSKNVENEKISALEKQNAELVNDLKKLQAKYSVIEEDKIAYKTSCKELSQKLEKAVADKISAENKCKDLQRQLDAVTNG